MSTIKNNKGITLIALVITIIVLLILAGVAISLSIDSGGLFSKTKEAAEGWNTAVLTEDSVLKSLMDILDTSTTVYFEGKTLEEVSAGDDMTIGIKRTRATSLEKFKIIKKDGNIITAIPYYNITLDETEPVQYWNAEASNFSSSLLDKNAPIDMTSDSIVIQKYIDAYKTTLQSLGAKNVNTRIATITDLDEIEQSMRNPSGCGKYWVGSKYYAGSTVYVRVVGENGGAGGGTSTYRTTSDNIGVRPLVEIDMTDYEHITDVNLVNVYEPGNIEQRLVDLINEEDYGKSVNYSVTVQGETLNNWKIFYNDGTNVYLMYGDYLEASLMPAGNNIGKDISNYKYGVKSNSGGVSTLVSWIRNTTTWSDFAAGYSGAVATGSPSLDQLNESLKKPNKLNSSISGSGSLYLPKDNTFENCSGYWLNKSSTAGASNYCWYVSYTGEIRSNEDASSLSYTVRPVVCLPSEARGTVGESVSITY